MSIPLHVESTFYTTDTRDLHSTCLYNFALPLLQLFPVFTPMLTRYVWVLQVKAV